MQNPDGTLILETAMFEDALQEGDPFIWYELEADTARWAYGIPRATWETPKT